MAIVTTPSDLAPATPPDVVAPEDWELPGEQPLVTKYDWGLLGARITLSAAVYPLLVMGTFTAITSVAMIAHILFGPRDPENSPLQLLAIIPGMLVGGTVGGTMAMLAGGMWGGIVTVVVLPLVYLVAWSLQLRMSFVRLGAFSGGLVGFVAILPMVGSTLYIDRLPTALLILGVGPALTTIVGQLGGAWGGFGGAQNYRLELLKRGLLVEANSEPAAQHPPRFQFQIRHLLWATVWISLLLAAIRLLGLPFAAVLPLLCGWLAFQWAMLILGGKLLGRLTPWWIERRRRRST